MLTHTQHHTGYVYDPIFLQHAAPGHPERPRRLEAILEGLRENGLLDEMQHLPGRPATRDEVLTVHTPEHLEQVRRSAFNGGGYLYPDTYTSADSYDAALTAAGSAIDLTLAVLDGQITNGLALLRPPGHHAEPGRPMGFCLFNNIAIAARAAQQQRGIDRVAIVDFDVHHGNGTQAAFWSAPSVLYCSTHQYPWYPGTGHLTDTGTGAGEGTIVNLPLPVGTGDEGYQRLFSAIIIPVIKRFQPQLLLVSAGYDCHWKDPLAGLGLSLNGITWIVQQLVNLANAICDSRIVCVLEGGYDEDVLRIGIINTVRILLGYGFCSDPFGQSFKGVPDISALLHDARNLHFLI